MRLSRLALGCVLAIAGLPLACGDDSEGGVSSSAAGEAGQGGADDASGSGGTKARAGSSSGAGESAQGGAAEGGESSSTGGGEPSSDTCTPRDAIPDPVGSTLQVQPECSAPVACAGQLGDGVWAYSAICLEQQDIFQAVYDECPTSKLNGPADVAINGTLKLAAGVATHAATISGTGVFQIPNECHSCDCKGQQELLKQNGAGPNTFCYEDCYPDLSCRCLIDFELEVSQEEAFSVSGHELTVGGATYDFCATDASLSLVETSASPALPGTVSLIAAGLLVTPEICDGLDNDQDGTVDDDPLDCPPEPCLNQGVCAGSKPTCSGQWLCDYSALGHEAGDETTCDGLDNDCDGEVDEKLVGCFEKCDGLDNDNDGTVDDGPAGSPCSATLGVCATGASSTCLGEDGWRCDFSSAQYELGETTCGDAKDNDCDGQVDEGCACPLGKSQMFVAHWGDTPQLIRADLDGSSPQIITALSGFALSKVVVDSKANKIYFGDGADKIQRANLDGSNIELLYTGKSQTWDVSPATGLLLGECNTSNLCRLTAPSTPLTLVQPAAVAGMDIDPVNQVVYWSDYAAGYEYNIMRADLDGSNVTGVTQKSLAVPLTIEVDATGQKLYWPNGSGIYEAGLDGSNEQLFLSLPSSYTYDLEIDPVGRKMYFSDVNANQVRRVNLDGTGYEPVLENITYAVSISLYVCP